MKKFFTKGVIIATIIILLLLGVAGFVFYQQYQQKIQPFELEATFGDTPVIVTAKYDTSFKQINVRLEIQEKVEQWQLDELGPSTNELKLKCTSTQGTQREFIFPNVGLMLDSYIYGVYSISGSATDFAQLKEIMNGADYMLTTPPQIQTTSSLREKLKKVHYQQLDQEKRRRAMEAELEKRNSEESGDTYMLFGM